MKGIASLVRVGVCFAVAVCLGVVAFGTSLVGDLANNATRQLRQACRSLVGDTTSLTPQESRHDATYEDGNRYASITLIGYKCPDDALQDYVGQQLHAIVTKARQEHGRVPASPRVVLPSPVPVARRDEAAVPVAA